MAIDPNALTTVVKVKAFLEIDYSDDDDLIADIINAATANIEGQTNTLFKLRTITDEVYDGMGSVDLILNQSRVTEITKVEYRSGDFGTPNWTEISSDEYSLDVRQSNIYRPAGWSCGRQNYRTTYKTGSAVIPYDIEMLCRKITGRIYDKRKSQGKNSEAIDGASINWENAYDKFDNQTLEKYNNWRP